VAGVVTLMALSIVAGLSSTPTSTTSAGLAYPATSPSSNPATQAASNEPPPPTVAGVTSAAAKPASPRPLVKVPTQRPRPSAAPRSRPTTHATTRATPKPAPKPARKPAPPAPTLCGAPSNPWSYGFCGGAYITSPPSSFCSYFDCIPNFPNGKGYVEQCVDGMFSKSGGRQGACSYHGGERRPLLRS
jgi:hypothetical protein